MRNSVFFRAYICLALVCSVLAIASPAQAQARCDIVGTNGDDVLIGTEADETICGFGGNDRIEGGGGDDRLEGGGGNDLLLGGSGNDLLLGGPGDDVLNGQLGRDRVNGQRGADRLQGGPGRDRLLGGPGDDVCDDRDGRTRSRSCEGGAEGLAAALGRWERLAVSEYVFAQTSAPSGPDVVLVRNEVATVGEFARTPPRTVEQLLQYAGAQLAAGGVATFDASTGIPVVVVSPDGARLEIHDFQDRTDLRSRLIAATEAWEDADIGEYSFVFQNICFCLSVTDIEVQVVAGEVVSAEPVMVDEPEAWVPEAATITDHLADIAGLLDGHNISVDAAFDADLGFPVSYGYDVSRLIADEELSVRISNFVRIDEPEPEAEPADGGLQIVEVEGIEVSAAIAEDLAALLAAAADDGFALSGGGFRDPSAQIALRRANCGTSDFAIWEMPASQCSPPTARPGQSQHELGLAVDFTNEGLLITSRNDAAFLWLEANAATYGLFNLPAEPWHWSVNGN